MTTISTTTKISREDFYKLEGLLALAKEHEAAEKTIYRAACQITGDDPEDYGHTQDAVFEGYSATELLRKMEIEVKQ